MHANPVAGDRFFDVDRSAAVGVSRLCVPCGQHYGTRRGEHAEFVNAALRVSKDAQFLQDRGDLPLRRKRCDAKCCVPAASCKPRQVALTA